MTTQKINMLNDLTTDYLPEHVLQLTFPIQFPKVIKYEHAVMALLDMSGYTQLTRILLEKNAAGFNAVEWVGKTVKECLNPIVDVVVASGGDIVKYAGDSITVLWYNKNDLSKAVQCCVNASRLVQSQVFKGPDGEEIKLGLHSVVHEASLYMIYVGNEKRVDSICFGREYVRMCDMIQQTPKDCVLILERNHEMNDIQHISQVKEVRNGLLLQMVKSDVSRSTPFIDLYKSGTSIDVKKSLNIINLNKSATFIDTKSSMELPILREPFKAFIDDSILVRGYSAEIHLATVVFAHLEFTMDTSSLGQEAAANQFAFYLQDLFNITVTLLAGKGILRQVTLDDKGLTIFVLFGLPPFIQESSAAPAGLFSTRWLSQIRKLPFVANVGMATDRVFSGLLSCPLRKEHALLGGAVNLAARLMMQNIQNSSILCDSATAKVLKKITSLKVTPLLNSLQLKGFSEPVPAYSLTEATENNNHAKLRSISVLNTRSEIKFHKEQDDEVWQQRIDQYLQNQKAVTLFIEGQSGCGKTVTASRILEYCKGKNFITWQLASFEVEALSPFHTLRTIESLLCSVLNTDSISTLAKHLGLDATEAEFVMQQLNRIFQQSKAYESAAPSAHMSERSTIIEDIAKMQTRIVSTLVQILNALSEIIKIRLVICLDDCQWQDRFSWTMTHAMVSQCPNLIIVLISRPPREYLDPLLRQVYEGLKSQSQSLSIEVGHIKQERLQEILNSLFHTNSSRLAAALYEQTQGNAFAIDVLLKYLIDSGKLETKDLEPTDILPRDMTLVFVSQLNKLDAAFQKMIRTASLIGQVFDMNDVILLSDINSLPTKVQIHDWDKFEFLMFMNCQRWRFRHCMIQFQIACLITMEERKPRHRAIGDYFSSILKTNQIRKSELLPIIYHQYQMAEYEEGMFNIGCKLVSQYIHLDMPYDGERVFLKIVDSPRFKDLPVLKQLKLVANGFHALDCTNNLKEGLLLLKVICNLVGTPFSKYLFIRLYYFGGQFIKMTNYWKSGKLPNVFIKDNISDEEIVKRLLLLLDILDCYGRMVRGDDRAVTAIGWLQCLFTLFNMCITYQHLLNKPLWMQVCGAATISLAFMGNLRAFDKFANQYHLNDPEKSGILEAFRECNHVISRRKLDSMLVYHSLALHCTAVHVAASYNMEQVILCFNEIEQLVEKFDWIEVISSSANSSLYATMMYGKNITRNVTYLTKIRCYLSEHPASSYSLEGLIYSIPNFFWSFTESKFSENRKELDLETKQNLDFLENLYQTQYDVFGANSKVNFTHYRLLHIMYFQQDNTAAAMNSHLQDILKIFQANKQSPQVKVSCNLAATLYLRLALFSMFCDNNKELMSYWLKYFSLLERYSRTEQRISFKICAAICRLIIAFIKNNDNVLELADKVIYIATGSKAYFTLALTHEIIYRHHVERKLDELQTQVHYQAAKSFYKENRYLWSLHYLDDKVK